jgi:fatty acid desaturase
MNPRSDPEPMKLTATALTVALILVLIAWIIGLIPWWLATPVLMVIGAASLAGLVGKGGD